MKKLIAPQANCFQAWLASMMDVPLDRVCHCSTEHDNWKQKTEEFLEHNGYFMAEVNPRLVSQLPHGALIGAHINGVTKPHIVIAKVSRYGPRHAFEIYHDPSQRRPAGTPIQPSRIVLICKLDK